ncbi:MAG: YfiR family protein [Burkholderiaceae bacterium]
MRSFPVRCLILCLALGMAAPAPAQQSEYAVKLAFLFNFGLFAKPTARSEAAGSTHYDICLYGENPFGPSLHRLEERSIDNRPIRVRQTVVVEELAGCAIAFFANAESPAARLAIASLEGRSTITVSQSDAFEGLGTIFNLVLVERKVAFEVNLKMARRNGIGISSSLLQLARAVL